MTDQELMEQTFEAFRQWSVGECVPDGMRCEYTSRLNEVWTVNNSPSFDLKNFHYRIVPINQTPKMVPLDASDIKLGVTVLSITSSKSNGSLVIFANSTDVIYFVGVGAQKSSYQSLFDDEERVYSNDGGNTWNPCRKLPE